jgi:hypothetical protein
LCGWSNSLVDVQTWLYKRCSSSYATLSQLKSDSFPLGLITMGGRRFGQEAATCAHLSNADFLTPFDSTYPRRFLGECGLNTQLLSGLGIHEPVQTVVVSCRATASTVCLSRDRMLLIDHTWSSTTQSTSSSIFRPNALFVDSPSGARTGRRLTQCDQALSGGGFMEPSLRLKSYLP